MVDIWLNGRILGRPAGGVRRYAAEVADHLDCRVAVPRWASTPASGRLWEQTTLARRSRRGVLINLAHSAPVAHPRSVVVVHDLFALDQPDEVRPAFAMLMRRQLPAVIGRAAAVVAVSAPVAAQIEHRFGRSVAGIASPGVSAAFSPGCSSTTRRQLGLDTDRPVVGGFLDPTPRKGSHRLRRALEMIERSTGAQIVIGRRSNIGSFAVPVGDDDDGGAATRWTELVDPTDTDLATMYRACDVVVCAGGREGWGLVPVEAAACGTAVVSAPVPSVSAAGEAIAAAGPDAEDLADRAGRLLADDARRHGLARAGSTLADRMTWSETAAVLQRVCADVAAVSPPLLAPESGPVRRRNSLAR